MTPDRPRKRLAVARSGVTKPDPDEPWRYVCPDCGGQVHGDHNAVSRPYRCTRCGSWFARDDLEDQKG